MHAITFWHECCKPISYPAAERRVNEEFNYWLPIIAGIVTLSEEDVSRATAEQEMMLTVVANKRIEIMTGGVD